MIGAAGFCGSRFPSAPEAERAGYGFGAAVFGILASVFACMIFCGYSQLKTAIDVLDASADFLAKTKRIFLVPTLYMFVQIIFVLMFLFSVLAIGANGDITPKAM